MDVSASAAHNRRKQTGAGVGIEVFEQGDPCRISALRRAGISVCAAPLTSFGIGAMALAIGGRRSRRGSAAPPFRFLTDGADRARDVGRTPSLAAAQPQRQISQKTRHAPKSDAIVGGGGFLSPYLTCGRCGPNVTVTPSVRVIRSFVAMANERRRYLSRASLEEAIGK